ncbi:MAG: ribose 1,5-bisphosphate isomerase [Candidatus Undinarchaeales archaeon]|jgi:ribose 1,5-bisphosphate isomerase|nr:ribose 1,5-bisphosphate isomerase [Candidatus Undinarchaeales archaeon]MDP7491330.1 ribose 1,5-bisphosphate isomerase [Candidatus Undinarchaeales archaeon]
MVAENVIETHDRIKDMSIRGAERIAVGAASSMRDALAAERADDVGKLMARLEEDGAFLAKARPSAVTLPNAVNFVLVTARRLTAENPGPDTFRLELTKVIEAFIKETKEAIPKIGRIGARRVEDGYTIMTHCNSSTAIAVIAEAHRQGKDVRAICHETRPWGQGYLTAQQLSEAGVPTTLIVDSGMRYMMKKEKVDLIVVGADSITAHGAVVNKIGTSILGVCAKESRIQFLVAAQTLKFDPRTIMGDLEIIEERDTSEITDKELPGVQLRNPVFDITPAEYVDLIITEIGALPPSYVMNVLNDRFGWAKEQ